MSNTINTSTFSESLYLTLPPMYGVADISTNYALKRYLEALNEGGYAEVAEDTTNLLELLNPSKIPASLLPIVFSHYGLEIFNGLPELFLRKMLPMISELYSRKGTTTVIEYLTSILSGVKTVVEIDPDFNETYGINIRLEMDYSDDSTDLPDRDQMLRIIKEFLPFFCNVLIVYSYLFYENARLRASDYHSDKVFSVNMDIAVIKNNNLLYEPVTNKTNYVLNSSFILNKRVSDSYTPDEIKDKIKISGLIDHAEMGGDTELLIKDIYGIFSGHESNPLISMEYLKDVIPLLIQDSQEAKFEDSDTSDVSLLSLDNSGMDLDESYYGSSLASSIESVQGISIDEYSVDKITIYQLYEESDNIINLEEYFNNGVSERTEESIGIQDIPQSLTNNLGSRLNSTFRLNSKSEHEDHEIPTIKYTRYSASPDGSNMTDAPDENTHYVGVGYMLPEIYENPNLLSVNNMSPIIGDGSSNQFAYVWKVDKSNITPNTNYALKIVLKVTGTGDLTSSVINVQGDSDYSWSSYTINLSSIGFDNSRLTSKVKQYTQEQANLANYIYFNLNNIPVGAIVVPISGMLHQSADIGGITFKPSIEDWVKDKTNYTWTVYTP